MVLIGIPPPPIGVGWFPVGMVPKLFSISGDDLLLVDSFDEVSTRPPIWNFLAFDFDVSDVVSSGLARPGFD